MAMRLVRGIGVLLVVLSSGCSCVVDAGKLDAIRCETENDCLRDEACRDGYCQVIGSDGDADTDADTDGDTDADADADAGAGTDGGGECGDGEEQCPDGCFDLSTSASHCGDCDRSCDEGQVCRDGDCEGSRCDPGLVYCPDSNVCVSVATDPDNCGACGNSCGAGVPCQAGRCAGCADGQTDCDEGGGLACRDLGGDPRNCGACGHSCQADEFCNAGSCDCRPGLTDCGAGCVSLDTSRANCGGCGSFCGDVCELGQCVDSCNADGLQSCDGYCTDTDWDPLNCGDCREACAVDELCIEGSCRAFRAPLGCDACPCDGCDGDFSRCCQYPGADLAVCVDAERCPLG